MTIQELHKLRTAQERAEILAAENRALREQMRILRDGDPVQAEEDREVISMMKRKSRVIDMENAEFNPWVSSCLEILPREFPSATTPVCAMARGRNDSERLMPPGTAATTKENIEGEKWAEFVDYALPEKKTGKREKRWTAVWTAAGIGAFILNEVYKAGWIGLEAGLAVGIIMMIWAGLYAI